MTIGYPALYRQKCLECQNLEMWILREREREREKNNKGELNKAELINEKFLIFFISSAPAKNDKSETRCIFRRQS